MEVTQGQVPGNTNIGLVCFHQLRIIEGRTWSESPIGRTRGCIGTILVQALPRNSSNTSVAGRKHDSHTHQSKLHILSAFAGSVTCRARVLIACIGNGDDICRVLSPTVGLAGVCARARGIVRIIAVPVATIAALECAVRTIDGIKKVIICGWVEGYIVAYLE